MTDSKERQIAESQKEAADSLRRQIQDLAEGKTPARKPTNLRDFVERKMAEDKLKNIADADDESCKK
jgi:hypothetical protein